MASKPQKASIDAGGNRSYPPSQNCEYQEFRDPAMLHDAYVNTAHCRDFISLAPSGACWHQVGYLTVNSTVLMSTMHTATLTVADTGPDLHLLTHVRGSYELRSDKEVTHIKSGDSMLVASFTDREWKGAGGTCAIRVRPSAVAASLSAMAGRAAASARRIRKLDSSFQPLVLGRGANQSKAIHALIRYIDDCFSAGLLLAARLGLDDVIHRTVASLLQPELLTEEPADLWRHRERTGKDAFDELIDYIRANLDQPLRMSDLEARSHYSRRALQYTFQNRLGCSPKQWIRQQRLALALEQLQADGKRPTIKSVALACGYLDASHFCTDFKRRYGMTPLQASRL